MLNKDYLASSMPSALYLPSTIPNIMLSEDYPTSGMPRALHKDTSMDKQM